MKENQSLRDFLRKAKRGPQIIPPKDFGTIIAETGCGKGWKVVDAGTGSGFMAMMFANIGCKVFTYEIDWHFFQVAKRNIANSGLEDIFQKNADITKGIEEKNVDLVMLDMQNPEDVVKHAYDSLKRRGWLVVYSLHVEQLQRVWKEMKKYDFSRIRILEDFQREWQIEGDTFTRPVTHMLAHTGFLTFARK
jgi:tRNA (adenine57-N1/adenine58-N1)-methyltransferase